MGQTAFRGNVKVTFESGQTTSLPADVAGNKVAAIYIPAGWSGTSITFEASPFPENETSFPFQQVTDDLGVVYTVTVAAGTVVALDTNAMALAGARNIKLVTDVAPGADTDLYLLTAN